MASIIKVIGNVRRIISHNNGIIGSFLKMFRHDDLKWGTLVGEDKYGNKYYENNYYFFGKNRWVSYPQSSGFDFDASEIPPEWHRWMHYMTDDPPTKVPLPQRKWMADHTMNLTGTSREYVPYSTTRPKIQSWVPPKSSD
ncbi:NADH dehydrogenase 1 alpha subcomplex subunit 12 ndufa12/DAP13 [Biomphalaria glabrata]|uniref:NADH dehydrogenase [ubiquinone] 1 alpha subcomplex subunit 12 n=2 Tax=Biomphalaria glabrata TaxID=6526 RepID=A0A9W3A395_BIOGL|nr:NADH dehydrogenase [ubiquinone] 1 alpha subcomplex subunit 12-like [Biomphalaria glabrata]KAI8733065.1 NADH dehydrogenase [ubiquinone] 1 alpha subcomplex subunit 12-like [Biomphalaria glabrata]KAI8781707.1 NADH dehydrogenase [ubiquinone] 1 alpha subcomplex subunit 12 [Biomphalaria glabrata]